MAMLMSIMSFAETYTHTFVKGEMKTGSVTLSDVTWNTAADPGTTAYNWDTQATAKGIQIGTSKAPCKSYTFSTSHFVDYMVTNITVNASTASDGTAKMQVSVGGVDYIAQTALTKTATNYTGSGASQGDVVISFTNTSKAFYIKSISITYQAVSAGEGMILVDQSNVDFGKITKTQTITVTGQNLTSLITAQLQDGSNFSVEGTLTAEGGELTVNYIATEAGKHTDVLVLTSDDVTTEVALAGEVVVLEGAGTKENPYTVADVIALGLTDKTQAWVVGYIIGTMKDNALEETPSQSSNIVLAAAADVKENYVPVALASGTDPRAALNVVDNPTMLGAKVAVYGTLETYFSKPGVKTVSDYTILTQPVVNHTITVSANPAEAGTVTGGGEVEEGTEASLTATANEGYEFVKWTEGETVVSTEANYSFEVLADRNLVANFKKSVVTHDFYVENVTVTEGEWSIDLAGSWNEQAFILKLWQDNTEGFGTYAANAETGYAATLGVKELTPTAEGNFMQDPMNENAFIFQGTMTDGTDIYEVFLKGALASSTGTGKMEAKDDVAFSCDADGAWTIEAYADDMTWGLALNVAQNPETMEWIATGYYITNLEAEIMEEAEGTGLLYFDDFSGRQVFKGTLTTTSGEIYPTLYASSLTLMTNDFMTAPSWVGEFAGVDYYEVLLMAADGSWELDLHARNCTGANGTYTVDVVDEAEGAYSTFMASTIVTGELTIEDGMYEANVTTVDSEGTPAMSISVSAWEAEAAEYNVVIENATVTKNNAGYNIDLTGEWDGHTIKVEVCDELTAETISANFFIDGGIANGGDQAEGKVTATVSEGVVTITGAFECLGSGNVYNVTISGKLPEGVSTDLENNTITVKAAKVIRNGKLIIRQGDVEFNAQGAIIK